MTTQQDSGGRHERINAFDAVVPRDVIPRAGLEVTFDASPGELEQLATDLGLAGAHSVQAQLDIRNWRKGGIVVSGRVKANLSQTCVVTLEPVVASIDEEILLRLVPAAGLEEARVTLTEDEAEDLDALEGDAIPVGAIVRDTVALALDPYPHAPGAELPESARDEEGAGSPFSVLEKLRPKT